MDYHQPVNSYEYKNDYLYLVIREAPELGPLTYLACSGINLTRFDALCRKKAGICSNPAFRGLQLLQTHMADYALKHNFLTRPAKNADCASITPQGEGWYKDRLLIVQATPGDIREVLDFSVRDLVGTVLYVAAKKAKLAKKTPSPPELQKWLDSLSNS